MGQAEIIRYLREVSTNNYRGFITCYQIAKQIKADKGNVSKQVHQLLAKGILERNLKGGWCLAVRIKEEHITSEYLCNEQNYVIQTCQPVRGAN